jgi:hypothetical protein
MKHSDIVEIRCGMCNAPMRNTEEKHFPDGRIENEYICNKHSLPIRIIVMTKKERYERVM